MLSLSVTYFYFEVLLYVDFAKTSPLLLFLFTLQTHMLTFKRGYFDKQNKAKLNKRQTAQHCNRLNENNSSPELHQSSLS